MNKQQAIAALNNGAVLVFLSGRASIDGQTVRIDVALNLIRSILKFDKIDGFSSFFSLKTEEK